MNMITGTTMHTVFIFDRGRPAHVLCCKNMNVLQILMVSVILTNHNSAYKYVGIIQ